MITAEYIGQAKQITCGFAVEYKRYKLSNGGIIELPIKSSWTIEDYLAKHVNVRNKLKEVKK